MTIAERRRACDEDEQAQIWTEFRKVVNMSARELAQWLETEESRAVGWTHEGEDESVGHHSGRRIVEILGKKKQALDADDYAHMQKVVGFAYRHLKQGGPAQDRAHSRWRYSLMNWGHDPMKQA